MRNLKNARECILFPVVINEENNISRVRPVHSSKPAAVMQLLVCGHAGTDRQTDRQTDGRTDRRTPDRCILHRRRCEYYICGQFCSVHDARDAAVFDPTVGHTMYVLSPFIPAGSARKELLYTVKQ